MADHSSRLPRQEEEEGSATVPTAAVTAPSLQIVLRLLRRRAIRFPILPMPSTRSPLSKPFRSGGPSSPSMARAQLFLAMKMLTHGVRLGRRREEEPTLMAMAPTLRHRHRQRVLEEEAANPLLAPPPLPPPPGVGVPPPLHQQRHLLASSNHSDSQRPRPRCSAALPN